MEVYPKNRLLRCNGNLEKKMEKEKSKLLHQILLSYREFTKDPSSPSESFSHSLPLSSVPHFPSFLRPIPFSFFLKHPYSFQFNFLIKIKFCRVNYYYVFNCPMLTLGYIYIFPK